MAERIAYLQAVVGADISSFRYGMQRVRNEIGILGNHVNAVSETARLATFTLSAPLGVMGAGFLKASSDFDASMRDINSVALLTENQLSSLSAEVIDYAQEVRAGGNALASSLATVYRAGIIDQSKAMDIMRHSVKTAEAGLADINDTTRALVGTVQAYSTQMMTAERASNAMTRLMQVGVGTMGEFGNAIAKINPLGSALNIEIEELYSHLAFLTQKGLRADTASTQLRQALTQLVKPTTALQEAFKTLGVSGAQELIDKLGGLQPALQAIIGTTDGSAVALGRLFTNLRGMQAVLQFGNDMEGLGDVIGRFYDNINLATQSAWEQQMKSFSAQVDLLRSAWEKLSITIGNILMPIITPLIQALTNTIKHVSDLDSKTLQLGVVIGGLTAILPPLIWLFTSMINPIGLVIAGVTALVGLFTTDFMGIRTSIMAVVDDAIGGLDNLKETVYSFITDIFPELGKDFITIPTPQIGKRNLDAKVLEFTVGQGGQTLYDFWESQLRESHPDWNAFYREMVVEAGRATGIGERFSFTLGADVDVADVIGEFEIARDMAREAFHIDADAFDTSTFWDRLTDAIANATPAVEGILSNIRNWFNTTLIPSIFNIFTVDENTGDSPLTAFLESILFADLSGIQEGANEFFTQVGEQLAESLPLILPELSRGLGLLVGRGATLFAQFVTDVAESLANFIRSGDGGGLFQEVVDLIITPFIEGIREAFDLSNLTQPQQFIGALALGLAGLALAGALVVATLAGIKSALLVLALPFTGLLAGVTLLTTGLGAVATKTGLLGALSSLKVVLAGVGTALTTVFLTVLIPLGLFALKIGLVVVALWLLKSIIDLIVLAFTDWDEFVRVIEESFAGFITEVERVGNAIQEFLQPALDWLNNTLSNINNAITDTLNGLSELLGTSGDINLTGGGGGGDGGRGFGGYATGGNVQAGVPSIVGETGRELFIPNSDGRIIPNWKTESVLGSRGSAGGGSTNVIHIHGVNNVDAILSELKRRGIRL